jgi:tetratricopeptide (TPR) repeat protein
MNLKHVLFTLLCVVLLQYTATAQSQHTIDSLKRVIATTKSDSVKIYTLLDLSFRSNFTQGLFYAQKALLLAQQTNYNKDEITVYNALGDKYWYHSDYGQAQEQYFKAYKLCDATHNQPGMAQSLYNIGWIYCVQQHDYTKSHYLFKAKYVYEQLHDTSGLVKVHNAIGTFYYKTYKAQKRDSALYYYTRGLDYGENKVMNDEVASIYNHLFDVYYDDKQYSKAISFSNKALQIAQQLNDYYGKYT